MADIENKYPLILSYENGKSLFCCPWHKYALSRLEKANISMMDPGFECQKQPVLCDLTPKKDPERGHERRAEPPLMVHLRGHLQADVSWLCMTPDDQQPLDCNTTEPSLSMVPVTDIWLLAC